MSNWSANLVKQNEEVEGSCRKEFRHTEAGSHSSAVHFYRWSHTRSASQTTATEDEVNQTQALKQTVLVTKTRTLIAKKLVYVTQMVFLDRHVSGSGCILEFENLCAFWWTNPRSHQFNKRNQSGRTILRVTAVIVNKHDNGKMADHIKDLQTLSCCSRHLSSFISSE